ncbi:helix-turn-helix transcriptional regulator [Selenomonas sp. AE3005]|uniref:helix-turn-helix domain-containing protein n=1 Tax=Selenomonas sp. AE3005 TaxID=1485543 RepID=UPI000480699E|nr:helix-turn-helix transcriptional regulator [Selenomonas sp. AE3005]
MSKAGVSAADVRAVLMKDEEFKQEYERLQPRYALIAQLINARQEQKITQAEMAERMGTKRSNISRFESGTYNPSLDFLIRAAASLGKKIEFSLR